MADVAAAEVERPGKIVRVGDDKGVELGLGQLPTDPLQLGLGAFAGKLDRVRPDGRLRRRGAVDPDHVDQVDVDRRERAAGPGDRLSRRFNPSLV